MSLSSEIKEAIRASGQQIRNNAKPAALPVLNIKGEAKLLEGVSSMKQSSTNLLSEIIADIQVKNASIPGLAKGIQALSNKHNNTGMFRMGGALLGGVANVARTQNDADPYGEGNTAKGVLGSFAEGALAGGVAGHIAGSLHFNAATHRVGAGFNAMADEGNALKHQIGAMSDPQANLKNFHTHVDNLAANGTKPQQAMAGSYKSDLSTHMYKNQLNASDAHEDLVSQHQGYNKMHNDFQANQQGKLDNLNNAYDKVKDVTEMHNNLQEHGLKIGDVASHLHGHGVAKGDIMGHLKSPTNTAPLDAAANTLAGSHHVVGGIEHEAKKDNILNSIKPGSVRSNPLPSSNQDGFRVHDVPNTGGSNQGGTDYTVPPSHTNNHNESHNDNLFHDHDGEHTPETEPKKRKWWQSKSKNKPAEHEYD